MSYPVLSSSSLSLVFFTSFPAYYRLSRSSTAFPLNRTLY